MIGEVAFVEKANGVDNLALDKKSRAPQENWPGLARSVRVLKGLQCDPDFLPAVKDYSGELDVERSGVVIDHRAQKAYALMAFGGGDKFGEAIWGDRGVVVEKPHIVSSLFQGVANPAVVAGRITEVVLMF